MDQTRFDEDEKSTRAALTEVMQRVQTDTLLRDTRPKSDRAFGSGLMVISVFIVTSVGLPIPVDMGTRATFWIFALILLLLGAWYLDRAKEIAPGTPYSMPAPTPEPAPEQLRRVK